MVDCPVVWAYCVGSSNVQETTMKFMSVNKAVAAGVMVLLGMCMVRPAVARPEAELTINAIGPGQAENPDMWGIFVENICHDVDGGLYAQMIQNPDFQNDVPPADCKVVHGHWRMRDGRIQWPRHFIQAANGHDVAWISPNGHIHQPPRGGPLLAWRAMQPPGAVVKLTVDHRLPLSAAHPLSLQVAVNGSAGGVANVGYWGMPIHQGQRYELSFYARTSDASPVALQAGLANVRGTRHFAGISIMIRGTQWKRYTCVLQSNGSTYHGAMTLMASGPATFNINLALMFPLSQKNGRTEFFRHDIVRLFRQLHPGFIRFPGGNYIEGYSLDDSYNWRQTVGPMIDRPGHVNYWGYRDTDGFGYMGWLELAQKIHAAALYCTSAGLLHNAPTIPGTRLKPYIKEMLNAVAFANDPVNTRWGALRAKYGHPAPFDLQYIEIGNENGGPDYNRNYAVMAQALQKKYPNVMPIADDWGGIPPGPLSIIDPHFYPTRRWFYQHAGLYNHYAPRGPKIFVGEYAVGNTKVKYGDFRSTLAETAFMIGMERNCGKVVMASYGVTLDNAGAGPCPINLIEFNDKTAFGRSMYWVQYLFNHFQPAVVFPTRVIVHGTAKRKSQRFFADAGQQAHGGDLIIKVDNAFATDMPATLHLKGIYHAGPQAMAYVLHEPDPYKDNSFRNPHRVIPRQSAFAVHGLTLHYTFKPYSITVLRIPAVRIGNR
jgi:alpha-L-arabinofuranosidase